MENKYLSRDKWLENIIGKKTYELSLENEAIFRFSNKVSTEYKKFLEITNLKPVFIYSKIGASQTEKIKFLERHNFHLVDTNVIFKKKIKSHKKSEKNKNIRFAVANDEKEVIDISKRAFKYSRFHLDRKIGKTLGNKIKSKWTENFFRGKRGDEMVVSMFDKKIIGFLLLKKRNNSLIVDLIALDKKFRGRNIAESMLNFAEKNINNIENIIVGTQISNIPSIRLYEKCNFQIIESYYVFHYHNQ